jgi:hypothetical protein
MPRLAALTALTALTALAAPATAQAALTVDARSVGGRCDDSRAVAAVSAATPWCTLGRAAAAAPTGATVDVRAATYPRLTISGRRHTAPVAFTAAAGERPVVAGLTLTKSANWRFRGFTLIAQTDLTDVADLRFEANEVALKPLGIATQSGFLVTGARRVTWEDNHVHDGLTGILTRYGGLEDITIRGNRFERLGEDGVFVRFGKRVTIEGNAFTNVAVRADVKPTAHSDAVQVVGSSEDVRLSRNTVRGGRGFMIQFGPGEFTQAGAAHVRTVVTGNVLLGPDFAVRAYSAPGIRVAGNTAWGTGTTATSGIDIRRGEGVNAKTTGVVLTDNVIRRLNVDSAVTFASEARNLVEQAYPTGRSLGSGSLLGTAIFASPSTGDYRLVSSALAGIAGVGTATSSSSSLSPGPVAHG